MMGERLYHKGVLADCIISSPALRAKTTAKVLAKHIQFTKPIVYDGTIYEADEYILNKLLINLDDSCNTVFLVGHNPDLNNLTQMYVDFDENIPTLGIVEIQFNCKKWKNISSKNAKLISFDYPKRS